MRKFAVLGAARIAVTARAQTVTQKSGWAAYQTEINRIIGKVNGKCGSQISASYNQSTYLESDPIQDRTQSACQQAFGAMETVCATDAGKQAVKGLKFTVCEFSTTGTSVSVSNSTLKIKIDPKNSSITGKQPGPYSWKSALEETL